MEITHKLGLVEHTAKGKGWHAIAIIKDRHRDGTLPNGLMAFVRDTAPFEDQRCGTIQWAINDLGVFFFSGHYDLTRDEAMTDVIDRVQRTIVSGVSLAHG